MATVATPKAKVGSAKRPKRLKSKAAQVLAVKTTKNGRLSREDALDLAAAKRALKEPGYITHEELKAELGL